MNDKPLFDNPDMFEKMDEMERVYAPQQLPADDPAHEQVMADEGSNAPPNPTLYDQPAAAPVANIGSSPSSSAAPPNLGPEDPGGAPGNPNPVARNPLDTTNLSDETE